jgi:UDP:flavonoid glycosyltransferase YjiC (YdhE family)
MNRIVIVSARVGAGHDGAAKELSRRLADEDTRVDRYDYLDLLPGRLGRMLCDTYHRQLQVAPSSWDWLLTAFGSPLLGAAARRLAGLAAQSLTEVLGSDTTLAISTYPLATHALASLKRRGTLAAPLAVYLTDPSVHRLCVSSRAELTIAPNEIAALQARRLGAGRTMVASPLVAPGFRPVADGAERDHLRANFGLPAGRRLALTLSGSWGVGEVEQTAADVAATGRARPVVVCGRNDGLRERLERAGIAHVFGWVQNMPELMRACDLVVQNAGGLTTSEALASGLPVLTYRCLPGHGRANAQVLDADGIVPWVRRQEDLSDALVWAMAMATAQNESAQRALAQKALAQKALARKQRPVVERVAG